MKNLAKSVFKMVICLQNSPLYVVNIRDQARVRNFSLNGTQGEVGVSPKKKKKKKKKKNFFFFFFFFRETHFHSVTTQMQAVVTLSDNLLPPHRVSPSIKWQ